LEITDHPIPLPAQQLSLAAIGDSIVLAGNRRKWRFGDQGPGHLKATYAERQFEAVVDVTFTQRAYSLHLDHSSGLRQQGDEIHHNYNRWVNQLSADIDKELTRAAAASRK